MLRRKFQIQAFSVDSKYGEQPTLQHNFENFEITNFGKNTWASKKQEIFKYL